MSTAVGLPWMHCDCVKVALLAVLSRDRLPAPVDMAPTVQTRVMSIPPFFAAPPLPVCSCASHVGALQAPHVAHRNTQYCGAAATSPHFEFHISFSPIRSTRSTFGRRLRVVSLRCTTSICIDRRLPSRPFATGKSKNSAGRLDATDEAKYGERRREDNHVTRGQWMMSEGVDGAGKASLTAGRNRIQVTVDRRFSKSRRYVRGRLRLLESRSQKSKALLDRLRRALLGEMASLLCKDEDDGSDADAAGHSAPETCGLEDEMITYSGKRQKKGYPPGYRGSVRDHSGTGPRSTAGRSPETRRRDQREVR